MAADEVERAVTAIRAGQPVLLPTDTVYGLCVTPYREEAARRLYRLKGRDDRQPIALVVPDHEMLFECVPELRGRSGVIARTLLPGPYTLVFQNPARRYRWLTGDRPESIGVRIPELPTPRGGWSRRSGASRRRARTRAAAATPRPSTTFRMPCARPAPRRSTSDVSRARRRRCSTSPRVRRSCSVKAPRPPPRRSSASAKRSAADRGLDRREPPAAGVRSERTRRRS